MDNSTICNKVLIPISEVCHGIDKAAVSRKLGFKPTNFVIPRSHGFKVANFDDFVLKAFIMTSLK